MPPPGFMDDEVARLVEEFEKSQGRDLGMGRAEKEIPKKQLTEEQTKALLSELNHKQREELCQVLKAQQDGEKDIRLSPELARILQRFQRRAGLGPGGPMNSGEETWPMYLGIVLFIVIAVVFVYIYFQEQRASEEEERFHEEDAFWLFREFG
ncbi:unnamed protein product [Cladocopium goreaui]|uniref:Uncharacterized protein n=1 Tax=Cladocopium goreaui TaxID=2562237 RepID=A0A9P1CSX8_9DINO|nr:unnamed protein product [Cladocopium goreaui]|mmetsp:Transcript_13571/g.29991  ORF Transcript_13571/g.29991 Transcript_13571/m.29991 type:complete len:153 (-) Transcript_13571:25-483(-)